MKKLFLICAICAAAFIASAAPQVLINGALGTNSALLYFNSVTNQTGVFPTITTNFFNLSSVTGSSANTNIWPAVPISTTMFPNTYTFARHLAIDVLSSNMTAAANSGHIVSLASSGDGTIWQTNAFTFTYFDGIPFMTNLDTLGTPYWCVGFIINTNAIAVTNFYMDYNGTPGF